MIYSTNIRILVKDDEVKIWATITHEVLIHLSTMFYINTVTIICYRYHFNETFFVLILHFPRRSTAICLCVNRIFEFCTYLEEQDKTHPLVICIIFLCTLVVEIIRDTWMGHRFTNFQLQWKNKRKMEKRKKNRINYICDIRHSAK